MNKFFHDIELSGLLTFCGIILLFSGAVVVTLIAPNYLDPSWTTPTSSYQVQMYEEADPYFYISSAGSGGQTLQFVNHLRQQKSWLAFRENETVKIRAPEDLKKYVTPVGASLRLTQRLLLLRPIEVAGKAQGAELELYDPKIEEAFAVAATDGILNDWVDTGHYEVVDGESSEREGTIYVSNPMEFRVEYGRNQWGYSPSGKSINSLEELKKTPLAFVSRKDLIAQGEHIYAIEGCWYCHTDQTRTLIQDTVLNGSESYPAPPSSPREYIYQEITFPGTKRNAPDLSRVGVKRPSRDWHKAHFWSPKTASPGSIMPSFRHFFDFDPRGTSSLKPGVPNAQFEALFQYLMTKGTRITPPTHAWWLGRDPVQTKQIIEGKRSL